MLSEQLEAAIGATAPIAVGTPQYGSHLLRALVLEAQAHQRAALRGHQNYVSRAGGARINSRSTVFHTTGSVVEEQETAVISSRPAEPAGGAAASATTTKTTAGSSTSTVASSGPTKHKQASSSRRDSNANTVFAPPAPTPAPTQTASAVDMEQVVEDVGARAATSPEEGDEDDTGAGISDNALLEEVLQQQQKKYF